MEARFDSTFRVGFLVPTLLVVSVAACDDPAGPSAPPRIEVAVQPDSIARGDSLEIAVSVVNPTGEPVTVTSLCGGVLYRLEASAVGAGDGDVSLDGLEQGCFPVVAGVELPPGSRTSRRRALLARPDGSAAPPGRYRVAAGSFVPELEGDGVEVAVVPP